MDVERTLREAPRWDAQNALVTLADGIRVGVAPGFAEAIQSGTTMPLDRIEQAVIDAFAAWETPEVRFDVHFDLLLPSDVQLHAVSGATHPFFQGNGFSGFATIDTVFGTRRLTSGELGTGHSIWGGEILIAPDRLWQSFNLWVLAGLLRPRDALARFTNLMIHEIGHVLGLHHPNEQPWFNFDDDGDPFTVVVPDPLAPWEGMSISENVDPNAIMRGGIPEDFSSFIATELSADDRSGLNVLYPSLSLPEPGVPLLALAALAALLRRRGMLAAG